MDEISITFVKIIFLLGFTIHNIEEAVWLPRWSKYAKKFHEEVEQSPFIFAVIVVTIFGYLVTLLDILVGDTNQWVRFLYLGFVGMMGINAFFPHAAATIVLKKYAPGLITALCLNLPVSVLIIIFYLNKDLNLLAIIGAIVLVSLIVLFSLKYLFRLGKILLNFE